MSEWRLWAVDLLVVGATLAMTLSIVGVLRYPSVHVKLHAAAKGVVLGCLVIAVASAFTDAALGLRALLVAILLLLTTPVSAHVLARLEWLCYESRTKQAGHGQAGSKKREPESG